MPGANIARVSNPRNVAASMIVGAYHTAGQNGGMNPDPYPTREQLSAITPAIPTNCSRNWTPRFARKDQFRACAVATRYASSGGAAASDVRPAARLCHQRRRGVACGEILPHRDRRVRQHAAGFPLAPPGRAGAASPPASSAKPLPATTRPRNCSRSDSQGIQSRHPIAGYEDVANSVCRAVRSARCLGMSGLWAAAFGGG